MPQPAGRPPDRDVKARRLDYIKRLTKGEDVVSAARESGYVKPSEIRALEVVRDLGFTFPAEAA